MLRPSKCGILALLAAGCGGSGSGSFEAGAEAIRGARIAQVAELRDHDPGGQYGYGRVLALAEGLLVVSEPVNYSGHVHVYGRAGPRWVEEEPPLIPPPEGAWSGWIVAAAPGRVAVGSGAVGPAAVYLYERAAGGWFLADTLVAPPGANDFGTSLAMSERRLLVGGGIGLRRAVWDFERGAGGWIPRGEIPSPFAQAYDQWGAAMTIAGRRAVIADPSVHYAPRRFDGGVAVYDLVEGAWRLAAWIDEPGAPVGFGRGLAASGTTVAISAGPGSPAHVWSVDAAGASEEAELDDSTVEPAFGDGVALGDGVLVVGAGTSREGTSIVVGSVYVYLRTDGGWAAPIVIHSPEQVADFELFGRGLAASGSLIAVGVPGGEETGDEDDNGEVYLFEVKRWGGRR